MAEHCPVGVEQQSIIHSNFLYFDLSLRNKSNQHSLKTALLKHYTTSNRIDLVKKHIKQNLKPRVKYYSGYYSFVEHYGGNTAMFPISKYGELGKNRTCGHL